MPTASQRLEDSAPDRPALVHAGMTDTHFVVEAGGVVTGAPEVEAQALENMLLPRHRHRIGGESGIGPRLPADCIGEAAGVDREKVDPRIDILPHRHAPPFLTGSEVSLRHPGAVVEVEAGIFALADRRHGARHDAIEIGAEGKRPFLF